MTNKEAYMHLLSFVNDKYSGAEIVFSIDYVLEGDLVKGKLRVYLKRNNTNMCGWVDEWTGMDTQYKSLDAFVSYLEEKAYGHLFSMQVNYNPEEHFSIHCK